MDLENLTLEAESELIKLSIRANQAVDENDFDSGKVPDRHEVEYIAPFTERGQRAGYWDIHWTDNILTTQGSVYLRVYCPHNSSRVSHYRVREVDLVYTKRTGEKVVLDLEHIWLTDTKGFVGFNGIYAFCEELINQFEKAIVARN